MPIPRTWIALEKCAFCGLGFYPMWVVQFASCRHVYHDWCIVYHFGTSTKCNQQGCEEEMHELWWIYACLQKLDFSTPIEDGSIAKAQS